MHSAAFMYMSFFFRFRRVGFIPVVAIASVYTKVFATVNGILYKLVVDRVVLNEARRLGLEKHAQPSDTHKSRGFNFI